MDEDLKQKIWETFKDVFIKEGITSPDKLPFRTELPSHDELREKTTVLQKLGKVGKYVVILFKKGLRVIEVVVILSVFIGMVQKFPTRHPRAFEALSQIGESVKRIKETGLGSPLPTETKMTEFIVYNDAWLDNEELFDRDISALNDSGHISDGSFLIPDSAISVIKPQIIDLTDASAVVSDLTA